MIRRRAAIGGDRWPLPAGPRFGCGCKKRTMVGYIAIDRMPCDVTLALKFDKEHAAQ